MSFLTALLPDPSLWFFAAVGGGSWDVGTALGQIGVGALIAAPAYWYAIRSDRDRRSAEQRLEAAHIAMTARERELGAQALPIVDHAARVLEAVQQGMASQVQVARATPGDLDLVTRQLETLLNQMQGKERP